MERGREETREGREKERRETWRHRYGAGSEGAVRGRVKRERWR